MKQTVDIGGLEVISHVPATPTKTAQLPPRRAAASRRRNLHSGAVASGIARQAIDALLVLASDKVPQASSKTLAQRPATQEAVAKAEAEWRSARAFVYSGEW